MTAAPTQRQLIFERQSLHLLSLSALLAGVYFSLRSENIRAGELFGLRTACWVWMAVAIPILHQLHVWFCWRMELHARLLSRLLGAGGFNTYAALFSVLGLGRILLVLFVALSNQHSLPGNLVFQRLLALVLAVPTVYLFYSVIRYFGFQRAFGIDHFDPSYHSRPFVRKGIFRFTSNGMYLYGFLILWLPGLWFGSSAALIVALFNHSYIWIHYYCTELPDIRRIYADPAA